jgi:hypothetical protein
VQKTWDNTYPVPQTLVDGGVVYPCGVIGPTEYLMYSRFAIVGLVREEFVEDNEDVPKRNRDESKMFPMSRSTTQLKVFFLQLGHVCTNCIYTNFLCNTLASYI